MEPEVEKTKTAEKRQPFRKRYIHQGQNISYFRKREGLSQKELGIKIERSQQFISQIEDQEEVEEEVIEAIAKALNLEKSDITDWIMDNAANIFNIENMGQGEGSTNMVGTNNFETNHVVHINPIDKVCDLYEVIRKQDREIAEKNIQLKEMEIQMLKKENELLRKK